MLRSLNIPTIFYIKSCQPKANILLVQTNESISIYEAVEATLASFRNPGLKIELKNVLAKKMRIRVRRYLQVECLYSLTYRGLAMKYKTYNISKKKGHCRLNNWQKHALAIKKTKWNSSAWWGKKEKKTNRGSSWRHHWICCSVLHE